jgi:ribonucleoside-diphosphate reductase alpha chain
VEAKIKDEIAIVPGRKTLNIERVFTKEGKHPYAEVEWARRDVVMTNWRDGSINFEQRGVEFPEFWSLNAVNIVTSKYFRGRIGSPEREWSLKQLVDRVVDKYVVTAVEHGYMNDEQSEIFGHELKHMLIHQMFSFNSPVWFNVGTDAPQAVSACYILGVEDSMESILDWYKEEGLIFKGGSGAGTNLSRIRSKKEFMTSGGTASGPVSFMRGADASAGTIKSGGRSRRAAKMVILDVDHPDIEEFIETKVREEKKIKALRDAGFDMDLGGEDIISVQYQNANNSVRVTDEFMSAVEQDTDFSLTARTTGDVIEVVQAKDIFHKMAQAAWECADPGIQYDDTLQRWHTCPESGRINASNPCSEFVHLDFSSCNLSSLNLMKFLKEESKFDADKFVKAVEIVITAMEISISFADYPVQKISEVTHAFRELGIGYANMGALLMSMGHPYDSEEGRDLAAAITSLMTGVGYRRSAEIAGIVGPYEGYGKNIRPHTKVIEMHAAASRELKPTKDSQYTVDLANKEWMNCLKIGKMHGWRNSQCSVIAPTGTIGLAMDCDTTGIEPDLALVKYKKLSSGGSMQIVNATVPLALRNLGYQEEQVEAIVAYINEHGNVIDAPGLSREHYAVFDCAMGQRAIAPMGHVRMMAAVQPFISGAISKTVNMPEPATIEEVKEIYLEGWKLGLKSLAIYRNNCKIGQPLSDAKAQTTKEIKTIPIRKRLPKIRPASTVRFSVADCEGYLTEGFYDEDRTELGEIFIKMSKQGSTLSGIMDALSISVSIGLQYGVPLEDYIRKFINTRFEPSGLTDDSQVKLSSSVLDYIARRLSIDALNEETRFELGIRTNEERKNQLESDPGYGDPNGKPRQIEDNEDSASELKPLLGIVQPPTPSQASESWMIDAPLCLTCGIKMRSAGSCFVCEACGMTSGCS